MKRFIKIRPGLTPMPTTVLRDERARLEEERREIELARASLDVERWRLEKETEAVDQERARKAQANRDAAALRYREACRPLQEPPPLPADMTTNIFTMVNGFALARYICDQEAPIRPPGCQEVWRVLQGPNINPGSQGEVWAWTARGNYDMFLGLDCPTFPELHGSPATYARRPSTRCRFENDVYFEPKRGLLYVGYMYG